MIGKTLQTILDEKNTNPNELANMIGISNQTIYSIIKRDNMKIDLDVLFKICKALNVSIERFYSDYCKENICTYTLTEHEKKLIDAYRESSDMQKSVDKLLGLDFSELEYDVPRKIAARGGGVETRALSDAEKEAIIGNTYAEDL